MEGVVKQVAERDDDVGVVEGQKPLDRSLATAKGQALHVNAAGDDRVRARVVEAKIRGVSQDGEAHRRAADDVAEQAGPQEDVGDDEIRDARDRDGEAGRA